MKRFLALLVLLTLLPLAAAADYQVDGYVNDYAGILTPQEESQIQGLLQPLHQSNTAEIAVVTIPSLEGQPIETVAFEMADGVLGDKEKDNGLLLLIAVEDRKYRFEVGRGLEATLMMLR